MAAAWADLAALGSTALLWTTDDAALADAAAERVGADALRAGLRPYGRMICSGIPQLSVDVVVTTAGTTPDVRGPVAD